MRTLALVVLFVCGSSRADPSPEVQLTLLSLRAGERARVEKAIGLVEEMPLYRAQLELDPGKREVTGKLFITYVARKVAIDEVYLRINANQQESRVKLSHATVNGRPAILEQPEPTLYRVKLDPVAEKGVGAVIEVRLKAARKAATVDRVIQRAASTLDQTGPWSRRAFAFGSVDRRDGTDFPPAFHRLQERHQRSRRSGRQCPG